MFEFIVAGGGEGTYKYLYPITQSVDPALEMKIAMIIDVLPKEKLHPKMQEIIEQENIAVFSPDKFNPKTLVLQPYHVGAVLTPHDSHLHYMHLFASMGMPVYAEKPLVSTLAHLNKFLKMSSKELSRIYAAEYSTEGKALAFLNSAGAISPDDPRIRYLYVPCGMRTLYSELGKLRHIDGKILEGEGTAGTADHRAWLLEGRHGGMIRDLFSHLFGSIYDANLVGSDMVNLKVKLGRYEKGMALGTWRRLKSAAEGETYAEITGNFVMPYGMPSFRLEGGKYWPKHDRRLILTFEHGYVAINYEKPFETTVEVGREKLTSSFIGKSYPTMAFMDFQRFVANESHGHIGRAVSIVRFNEQARQAGLEQAGL